MSFEGGLLATPSLMSGDSIAGMHGRLLPNMAAAIGLEPAWILHCQPRVPGFTGYEQIVKSGGRHLAAQRDTAFFNCR